MFKQERTPWNSKIEFFLVNNDKTEVGEHEK